MATQRTRGQSIELRAYAGMNPATGKRHYLTETVPPDLGKRELDRRIRSLDIRANELAAGRRARRKDPAAERPKKIKAKTIGEAVEIWWVRHGSKLASAPKVRSLIDSIILPELGGILLSLAAGTPPDDDDDRDPDLVYLSEEWQRIARDRGLKPSTIHRCHGIVGAALRRAGHPISDPGLPSMGEPVDTTPLAEEMATFLEYLAEPTTTPAYRVTRKIRGGCDTVTYEVPAKVDERSAMDLIVEAFALLVMSGPRPVETAALTRDRLDLSTGRCSFDGRGVVLRHDGAGSEVWMVATGETVKRRKRVITLDPRTAGALRRWSTFQDEYALAVGYRLRSRAFVFSLAPDASVPISPKVVSKAFARQVTRARAADIDLPDGFHLYSCRHFGISQLLRAGHDVTAVAKRFGTSGRMIHQTYGHCIDADDSRLAESLGSLWPAAGSAGEVVTFPSSAAFGPSAD